ncbi:MAG TPA: PE-PPE domain-containing protein, partial [Mycobacterium sp.]|nr:PE-PPE domain-containing protein [Mycobacterium sp.]
DVSLASDPSTSPPIKTQYGDTTYYFFETQDLPLFDPLRSLGVPEPVIDLVEPFFRVLVELGYDRSIPPGEPTPARLIPTLDPAKVTADLVNAIGEGFNNALALFGLPPLLKLPAAPDTESAKADMSPQTTLTGTLRGTQHTTSTGTQQRTSTGTSNGTQHTTPTGTQPKSTGTTHHSRQPTSTGTTRQSDQTTSVRGTTHKSRQTTSTGGSSSPASSAGGSSSIGGGGSIGATRSGGGNPG